MTTNSTSLKDNHSEKDTATIVVLPEDYIDTTPTPTLSRKADHLQQIIWKYDATPDEKVTPAMVQEISSTMENIGRVHPNPRERKSWLRRAREFKDAPLTGRRAIARDIGVGLGLMVLAPIILSGAMIAAAGGILYGCGVFCKGLGGAMTFGRVGYGKKKHRTWEGAEHW